MSIDANNMTERPQFICSAVPSPPDARDYHSETLVRTDAPHTLDLRPDLQGVRNQGQQGSCAAQTAACCKEWQERIDIQVDEHLSPQFVYNCRRNQDTEGMYGRDVMAILTKRGICRERDYRYGTEAPMTADVEAVARNMRISGYARVHTSQGLKEALARNGPCYISFPCFNFSAHFWRRRVGDAAQGGHAVTVVGYDTNGFMLRNSWGDDWGDGGYTTYPYNEFGAHYEIWTMLDDESLPRPPPTSLLLQRRLERVGAQRICTALLHRDDAAYRATVVVAQTALWQRGIVALYPAVVNKGDVAHARRRRAVARGRSPRHPHGKRVNKRLRRDPHAATEKKQRTIEIPVFPPCAVLGLAQGLPKRLLGQTAEKRARDLIRGHIGFRPRGDPQSRCSAEDAVSLEAPPRVAGGQALRHPRRGNTRELPASLAMKANEAALRRARTIPCRRWERDLR